MILIICVLHVTNPFQTSPPQLQRMHVMMRAREERGRGRHVRDDGARGAPGPALWPGARGGGGGACARLLLATAPLRSA